MNSVDITNLTKIFKTKTNNKKEIFALNDISLSIEDGIFFGLLGPNGAGKSTLMNCLIGYLQPDSGKITLNGKNIDELNLSHRNKIGYVP